MAPEFDVVEMWVGEHPVHEATAVRMADGRRYGAGADESVHAFIESTCFPKPHDLGLVHGAMVLYYDRQPGEFTKVVLPQGWAARYRVKRRGS